MKGRIVTAKTKVTAGGKALSFGTERSNLTKLSRSSAMVCLTCPVCGINFERYACHAKRYSVSYCSMACRNEGQRIYTLIPCRNCGNDFAVIPSKIGKLFSCSNKCKGLQKRQKGVLFSSNWVEYKKAADLAKKSGCKCKDCGTIEGPFYARYVQADEGWSIEDISSAMRVQCKKCYWLEKLSLTPNHIKHNASPAVPE